MNILKNVKSVVVPNSNGLRGIKAATALGIVAGKKELKLECISQVTEKDREETLKYIEKTPIII